MDKKFQIYVKAISNYLNKAYGLNPEQINHLIKVYDLFELAKGNSDYFYYRSPEYWAEYLMS